MIPCLINTCFQQVCIFLGAVKLVWNKSELKWWAVTNTLWIKYMAKITIRQNKRCWQHCGISTREISMLILCKGGWGMCWGTYSAHGGSNLAKFFRWETMLNTWWGGRWSMLQHRHLKDSVSQSSFLSADILALHIYVQTLCLYMLIMQPDMYIFIFKYFVNVYAYILSLNETFPIFYTLILFLYSCYFFLVWLSIPVFIFFAIFFFKDCYPHEPLKSITLVVIFISFSFFNNS